MPIFCFTLTPIIAVILDKPDSHFVKGLFNLLDYSSLLNYDGRAFFVYDSSRGSAVEACSKRITVADGLPLKHLFIRIVYVAHDG